MSSEGEDTSSAVTPGPSVEIAEILERLPHRYPFLLLDRCEDYQEGVSIIGVKCVTVREVMLFNVDVCVRARLALPKPMNSPMAAAIAAAACGCGMSR